MPVHPFVFTKCQKYMTVVLFKVMSSQYIAHQFIHSCCNHKIVGIERTNISCKSIQLTDTRNHIEVMPTKKKKNCQKYGVFTWSDTFQIMQTN